MSGYATHRGRVAALSRSRSADDPELIEARRLFALARAERAIRRLTVDLPPMSPRERAALVAALTGGEGRG